MNDGEIVRSASGTLGQPSRLDHVVSVIKALMNAVPVVGGPLASLMGDYIPTSRAKRLEEFARQVSETLAEHAEALKVERVETDEFAYLFTRTFENAARDYQEEKLAAYRNILLNSLRVDVSASIQESYLSRVESLSPLHLKLLSVFVSDAANAEKLHEMARNLMTGSIRNTIQTLLPDFPQDHIKAVAHDLDTAGITGNLSDTLNTMMTARGSLQLEGRLTPYGRGFVTFISEPPPGS